MKTRWLGLAARLGALGALTVAGATAFACGLFSSSERAATGEGYRALGVDRTAFVFTDADTVRDIAVSGDKVYLATDRGVLVHPVGGGAPTRTARLEGMPGDDATAVAGDGEDGAWAVIDGELMHHVGGAWLTAPQPAPGVGRPSALLGETGGRVWLGGSQGLVRFDGTQWRMIRAPDRAIDPHGEAQVIEIGPSRFLATSPNPTELLEVDATDQVTPIELMTVGGDADAVTALALSPELGPLAATFNGRVYARSGAGWTELPVPSQAINTIYALIPLSGRGVLAGGRRSTFTQWYSGFGDCGFVGTTLGRNTRGLVALGPDVVAAVDGDAGENQVNVAYLRVP